MPNRAGISVLAPENGTEDTPVAPSRRGAHAGGRKPINYDVVAPSVEDWNKQKPEVVKKYLTQTLRDFFGILDEYKELADSATALYQSSSRLHQKWRVWTIVATGGLAALNVCVALDLNNFNFWIIKMPATLSAVAALYAACLTVNGNVETFFNSGERAAGFREMRELIISRYREYSSKWVCYVDAYGLTPTAYVNAGRLYRQLVDSDRELREKIKQLTEVKGKANASGRAR